VRTLIKPATRASLFTTVNVTVFIILTFLCIYPFYYLIINSVSANNLSAAGEVTWIPRQVHLSNYREVLRLPGLTRAMFISVARTVLGSFCTVMASAFMGFLFSKRNFWLRKFWYRAVVITMYFSAGLIPTYLNIHSLGLQNNFLVYILPVIVSPYNIILVKTYVESTPYELQEAAQIDGAGLYKVFFTLILPIVMPIIATILTFASVWQWNAFQDNLLYMTQSHLNTLQYTLFRFINQATVLANLIREAQDAEAAANIMLQQNPVSVNMTVSVIVILPILFVYPFMQKYFVKGIMLGAIKG